MQRGALYMEQQTLCVMQYRLQWTPCVWRYFFLQALLIGENLIPIQVKCNGIWHDFIQYGIQQKKKPLWRYRKVQTRTHAPRSQPKYGSILKRARG